MTSRDHNELLESLRSTHSNFGQVATRPTQPTSRPAKRFSELELYRRIALAKSAGDTLGVASPFFRTIDSIQGTQAVIDGKSVTNFASYDYLSLNQSDDLRNTVSEAAAEWGVSATASRLVGGERAYHVDLERRMAEFLGAEDAVTFVSGYLTNCSAIRILTGRGDLVLVDALAHNSIYEGIRASDAEHVSFPHNDWTWVSDYLEANRDRFGNVLIVVEGLYSMDGDMPDLARVIDVKRRHGAWLMVDEAHSIGVLGATGRGIKEEQGIPPDAVDVTMGTLSKTFCSCGGFLAGSQELGELLRHSAPGFVYSVGLPAPSAAAAGWALSALSAAPERVARLRALSETFQSKAQSLDLDTGDAASFAVQPVIVGDSLRATWVSNALLDDGFNVMPIIAPAVPDQRARLRFFLNTDHTEEQIGAVLTATARLIDTSLERFSVKGGRS